MSKEKSVTKKVKHCIFCDIVEHKRQQNDIVLQTQEVIVFHDISPAATYHLLACPVRHIRDAKQLARHDIELVRQLASSGLEALSRLGANTQDARIGFHRPPFTSVSHLHLHFISPVSSMGCLAELKYGRKSPWFVSVDEVIQHLQTLPAIDSAKS